MKIEQVERLALNIPFYTGRVRRAMQRAQTHDERVYVYRVVTDREIVGYGDSLQAHDTEGLVGKNPFAVMHDDSIGLGPQLAVLDVAGKAAGVPVHALLGTKVRDRCPISWWDIDMPAGDWVSEARESVKRGYTSFKMKARPWRDIVDQVDRVGKVVPADYKFDVDFNGFLLNQARAEVLLHRLDEHPNVGIYESPFYLHQDHRGGRILRERVRKPIVEHFREEYLSADCCDGFVIGEGVAATRRQADLAATFNKPFWIQQVGTGITTAFVVQLGAVLSHAQLPYITCHELWKHHLLKKRLKVEDGYIRVSDRPGLGVEVDDAALERYRVDEAEPTPKARYLGRKRILRIFWPGAGKKERVWEFTHESRYQAAFYQGSIPGFERGVSLEVIENDRSAAFKKRHRKLVEEGR